MAAKSLAVMLLVGSISLQEYQTASAVKLNMQMATDAEMALQLTEMLDESLFNEKPQKAHHHKSHTKKHPGPQESELVQNGPAKQAKDPKAAQKPAEKAEKAEPKEMKESRPEDHQKI